jgi:opacity protein-like surface antigen
MIKNQTKSKRGNALGSNEGGDSSNIIALSNYSNILTNSSEGDTLLTGENVNKTKVNNSQNTRTAITLTLALVSSLALVSTKAQALEIGGLNLKQYVGGGIGQDTNSGLDYKRVGDEYTATKIYSYDSPANTTISLKYGAEVLPDIRADVELTYGIKGEENVSTKTEYVNTSTRDVSLSTTSLILHGYYDVSVASYAGFTPFVGLGLGFKQINLKLTQTKTPAPGSPFSPEESSWELSDTALAYEAVLGVSYKINANLFADLTYTYGAAKFNGKDSFTYESGDVQQVRVDDTLETNSIKLGVRYGF